MTKVYKNEEEKGNRRVDPAHPRRGGRVGGRRHTCYLGVGRGACRGPATHFTGTTGGNSPNPPWEDRHVNR